MNPITHPDNYDWVLECRRCRVYSTFRQSQTEREQVICDNCGAFTSRYDLEHYGRHRLKDAFLPEGGRKVISELLSIDPKTGAQYTTPEVAEYLKKQRDELSS